LVKKAVVRRTFESKVSKKKRQKAPKIQRLVTDERLRRKKTYRREKRGLWDKTKKAVETYNKFVTEWRKKKSGKEVAKAATEAVKPAATTAPATKTAPAPAKGGKTTTAPVATGKTTAPAKTTTTTKAPAATAAKTTPAATTKPAPKK